jgi:hypothetical protein
MAAAFLCWSAAASLNSKLLASEHKSVSHHFNPFNPPALNAGMRMPSEQSDYSVVQ